MATTVEQTYANHAHRPIAWQIAWLGALLTCVLFVWIVYRDRSPLSIGLLALGLVTLLTITLLRLFVLRLQDRIIRLEMQVRLAGVGRADAIERLSVKQLVALRFAANHELATLADRAATENLSADQIKRAVSDWQADRLRT